MLLRRSFFSVSLRFFRALNRFSALATARIELVQHSNSILLLEISSPIFRLEKRVLPRIYHLKCEMQTKFKQFGVFFSTPVSLSPSVENVVEIFFSHFYLLRERSVFNANDATRLRNIFRLCLQMVSISIIRSCGRIGLSGVPAHADEMSAMKMLR